MRLLTHNSLRSYASDVTNGFPLKLEVGEVEVVQTDCNADFMQHMLPSLSWPAVLVAAAAVGMQGVPETLTPDMLGTSLRNCNVLIFVGGFISLSMSAWLCRKRRLPPQDAQPLTGYSRDRRSPHLPRVWQTLPYL
mmetsp:Transcript_16639/g.31190  ORF Transcript_16639/g.31190 Transcript_16639/m.31190 type:complete len:136 (-) Transcript_16639:287-694(-)